MRCNNEHHVLNEKGTCAAFAPRTSSEQPCSVVARPGEPRSDLTAGIGSGWKSPRREKMQLWWILLFGFWSACGELPFIAENNAAMLVNW